MGTVSAVCLLGVRQLWVEGKGIARHGCDIRNSSDQEKTHSDNRTITNQTGDLSTHIYVDCVCECLHSSLVIV